MAPGEVLSVSNIRGNLQVTGGAADRLQTRYTITVFAEDEAAAAQYAEALEVVAVRREEGLCNVRSVMSSQQNKVQT